MEAALGLRSRFHKVIGVYNLGLVKERLCLFALCLATLTDIPGHPLEVSAGPLGLPLGPFCCPPLLARQETLLR